jgi:hypothetical protein
VLTKKSAGAQRSAGALLGCLVRCLSYLDDSRKSQLLKDREYEAIKLLAQIEPVKLLAEGNKK